MYTFFLQILLFPSTRTSITLHHWPYFISHIAYNHRKYVSYMLIHQLTFAFMQAPLLRHLFVPLCWSKYVKGGVLHLLHYSFASLISMYIYLHFVFYIFGFDFSVILCVELYMAQYSRTFFLFRIITYLHWYQLFQPITPPINFSSVF